MNKTTLLAICSLTIASIFAQEENNFGYNKNDIIVSGTFNYSNNTNKGNLSNTNFENNIKSSNLSITPEIGYFLTSHFAAGARIGYLWSKSENSDTPRYTTKQYGFTSGVFGRYYFSPKKRINFFTEIESSYSKTNIKTIKSDSNSSGIYGDGYQNNLSFSLAPGINIFLNENLSITSRIGKIGYTKSKNNFHHKEQEYHSKNENSSFQASLSLDYFYFGISYRIH